jgi:activating signal cointegrator complex subunit 3
VQTQYFHTVYHTDEDVLLGAPTGSGKTVAAELAIMRLLLRHRGRRKVVYVAPMKALARERLRDWREKFGGRGPLGIGARIVELTGDVTPDMGALASADIIITTPEKWDGVSRSWRKRDYVKSVGLVILDEVLTCAFSFFHLLATYSLLVPLSLLYLLLSRCTCWGRSAGRCWR